VGLSVSVGLLDDMLRHDPEGVPGLRKEFAAINRLLKANKLPAHVEPTNLPELNDRSGTYGFAYSWLHYLRRAVAFARQAPQEFGPVAEGVRPSQDERIERELSVDMTSHLICHSDHDGYYVPIDFPEPLYGDFPGGILGSSQRALVEVILAAPLLGINLVDSKPTKTIIDTIRADDEDHPLWIERLVWLHMYETFRLSIEHKAAVAFH
jgi:hypothetical protein